MGFSIKKVVKAVTNPKAIAGAGIGSLIGGAPGAVVGGILGNGGFGDMLKENKSVYSADALAGDVNALGASGLREFIAPAAGKLNEKFYKNPEGFAKEQIGIENKLLRGASDDAAMRTKQLIAQRGMGNSSIGLGQEINAGKALSDKLAMNNASVNSRVKDLLGEQMQTGSNLFGLKTAQGPIQMQDITRKSGGLKGLMQDYVIPLSGPASKAFGAGMGNGSF